MESDTMHDKITPRIVQCTELKKSSTIYFLHYLKGAIIQKPVQEQIQGDPV